MLMWLWKIGLQQIIHEGFLFMKVRWRKVYSINKGIGRILIVRSEAFGLVPYFGAG